MKRAFPHGLTHELARDVTRKALDSYRQRFSEFKPEGEWTSADHATVKFHAAGTTFNGAVNVHKDTIDLELDVPFFMRPFEKKAIDVIEAEINQWIAKAKRGELG
jgi:hypothetical protein